MMRTAPYGIIVIDEAGGIIDFNPAAERIFGQRFDDVIGCDTEMGCASFDHG